MVLSFSCRKQDIINEDQTSVNATSITNESASVTKIGVPGQMPDLYIPEDENDWEGFESPYSYGIIGLNRVSQMYIIPSFKVDSEYARLFNLPVGARIKAVAYDCPIANNTPFDYTGIHDLLICRPCDGLVDEYYGGYNFPGMLAIEVFQNGLPVVSAGKQNFALFPGDNKVGFDWNSVKNYNVINGDTSVLYPGTSDVYKNVVPANEGKYVIVAIVNPDKILDESNYDNNASHLPINVSGINVTVDESALGDNKPHPATNLTYSKPPGKVKTLTLDWDCPYHSPLYIYHNFTLKQDGIVIATGFDTSNYTITLQNGQKHTYEIIINVSGLGSSEPISKKI